eukprot:TRINITY_DN12001_c0_g1_i1.p1 TRINITY_DN12001_c0_g1~~TRINITY_DN12001_c0_g1_i1.p1  ORF type:complete len:334 (-),score=70.77 TRINITY_DN12001_c0_g1_i1:23-997(-)
MDEHQLVGSTYGNRPGKTYEERKKSNIVHVRNFNNWVKVAIITKYCEKNYSVLDICGGKGGDLLKFREEKIGHYVLADVASGSVHEAKQRYLSKVMDVNDIYSHKYPALFCIADCFKHRLFDENSRFDKRLMFDFVNCQFALHYAFDSEKSIRNLLMNVTDRLKPGGFFVGTLPNSYRIIKKLQTCGSNSFGNSVYDINFPSTEIKKFGMKYFFKLEEAVEDLPEYIVYFPFLVELAKEYGLEIVEVTPFHEFYNELTQVTSYEELMLKMRVVTKQYPEIPKDQWEVTSLYMVFVFQKIGATSPTVEPTHEFNHQQAELLNFEN